MRIFFIEQITSPSPVMVYNGTAKLIFVNGCGVKVIAILSIIVFGIKWKKNYVKIGLTSHSKARNNCESGSKACRNILLSIY